MSFAPPTSRRGRRAGFTLVELMISLALVLLLTVAMTRIFGVTARAISKGTAVGEVVRGLDALRTALQLDFTGAEAGVGYDPYRDVKGILPLSRQPAIIISSKTYTTFLDEADAKSDSDGDPTTVDRDNDGVDETAANQKLTNFQTGRRWFRGDRLSFFARGDYKSQANLNPAADSAFIGDVTSPEAWVWYGHGRVYNGGGDINLSINYKDPGKGDPTASGDPALYNPNNFYASDWLLLRNAILLKAPVDHDATANNQDTVVDANNNPILHMDIYTANGTPWSLDNPRNPKTLTYNSGNGSIANVAPLRSGNAVYYFDPANNGSANAKNAQQPYYTRNYLIQHSRVDVAGLTAPAFREHLDAIQQYVDASGAAPFNRIWYGPSRRTWYDQLFATEAANASNAPPTFPYSENRFWVNPTLLRPLDPGETSQAASLLLPGCTQFAVEYAGDFLTQNANGTLNTAVTGGREPDGVIDFNVDANGVPHTRWYGLPRDVDGLQDDLQIPGPGAAEADRIKTFDTLPLADYTNAPDVPYPFEKRLPGPINATGPNNRASVKDYGSYQVLSPPNVGNNTTLQGNASLTPTADGTYVVAWGPGDFDGTSYRAGGPYAAYAGLKYGPALVRVVATGIDRQQKLEEPITQELVFRVPAQ